MKKWIVIVGCVSIVIVVRERQKRRLKALKEDLKKSKQVSSSDLVQKGSRPFSFHEKRLLSPPTIPGGGHKFPIGGGKFPLGPEINSEVSRLSSTSSYGDDGSMFNIGVVMGMDIGGSLAKLVYFEKVDFSDEEDGEESVKSSYNSGIKHDDPLKSKSSSYHLEEHNSYFTSSPRSREFKSRRRVRSPHFNYNLNQTDEQRIALQNFYTFMETAQIIGGRFSVRDEHLTVRCPEFGGLFHFFRFETRHMERAISLVQSSRIADHLRSVGLTGGGAYKYDPSFSDMQNTRVMKHDEMGCTVRGLQFATENIEGEVYSYSCGGGGATEKLPQRRSGTTDGEQDTFRNMRMRHIVGLIDQIDASERVYYGLDRLKASYPALVICIGSGVSILKVDGPSKFERVSGSSIGGGTFLGLCRLLTGANDFDMALDMASEGDSDAADMVVGDIYGRGYNKFQLNSDTLASSFGKVGMSEDPRSNLSDSDISKSLVIMITMNIGQVAYLNAKLHDTSTIFFIGNFLRHNDISARRLSFAMDYWSGGCIEALFLEHEGYLCALGCLLNSWEEGAEESGHDGPKTPPHSGG